MRKRDRLKLERIMHQIPGYDPWATAEGSQEFSYDLAAIAIEFFESCLCHVEGAMAGKPFLLEDWQKAIVGNLWGWRQKDAIGREVRRYREVLLYVPRKNGKTPLAAGIGLAIFTLDNEVGQQDYIAAADRDQAGMLFRQCSGMVERSPDLAAMYRIYGGHGGGAGQSKSLVKRDDPQSFLRVISADASTKHGGTSHLVLIDELHAQPKRDLVDVMRTSMASANRVQPLMIYLTTADYERESICNEIHDHACGVRDGSIRDSRFLPVIYEVKESDPWDTEATWRRANPNFGVSVSEEYIRREVELAKKIPARLNEFLRLHLNVRTKARTRWLSPTDWAECGEPIAPGELDGEPCIVGIDIGISNDLAAIACVFPRDGRFDVLCRFWIARKAAEEAERLYGIPYRTWERQGHITLTDGSDNNIDSIVADFRETECKRFDVREVVYDPWNFEAMAGRLANDGMTVVKCSQNMHGLNEPSKALEELVSKQQIRHGGNPVLSWCAENAEVVRDNSDNIRPVKPQNANHLKIDGIMAVIMGLFRAMRQIQFQSCYETEELFTA